MNLPNITPKHRYYEYWDAVRAGEAEPDEWQAALMSMQEQAHEAGLFYTVDVRAWIKERADFIPAEWWDYQYTTHKVEGGIMGMELYCAWDAVQKRREREADAEALKHLSEGQILGAMSVNHKRINKCSVLSIKGREVTIAGVTGRYQCTFRTSPRHIQGMIDGAVKRGWRKP